MRLPLDLGPYESKLIVIGPATGGEVMGSEPPVEGTTLLELNGDWSLDLNGVQMTTPLKSWEELGTQYFYGPAIYRKHFTGPTVPAGKHLYLELEDVHDYVRIRVNGGVLEAMGWEPFRVDVTNYVQAGDNELQINVYASPVGYGGSDVAAPAGTASATALNTPGGVARSELRFRGVFSPAVSGLLGAVRLVAR